MKPALRSRRPPVSVAVQHGRREPVAAAELTDILVGSGAVSGAVLDESYTVTAIMAEREDPDGTRHTILIEVLDAGPGAGSRRWMVMAFDELRAIQAGPAYGLDPHQALSLIPWSRFDSRLAG